MEGLTLCVLQGRCKPAVRFSQISPSFQDDAHFVARAVHLIPLTSVMSSLAFSSSSQSISISYPSSTADTLALRHKCCFIRRYRHNGAEVVRRRSRCAIHAVLPSDPAPDMLTFALSGPGVLSFCVFLGVVSLFSFRFLSFGPRFPGSLSSGAFILRVVSDKPFAYGRVTHERIRKGENILPFNDRLSANAAMEDLVQNAGRYGAVIEVYLSKLAFGATSREEPIKSSREDRNAPGGRWKSREVLDGVSDKDKVQFEYDSLPESADNIDEEWAATMRKLRSVNGSELDISSSPSTASNRECKMCGGVGSRRCTRCGGVSRAGGTFECTCNSGRTTCEYCEGSGLQ